jgi:glycine cleavage system regulatory protein
MPASVFYVISASGPDRSGLLVSICEALSTLGCSLSDSRFHRLAGAFSSVLVVCAPTEVNVQDLSAALEPIRTRGVSVNVSPLDDTQVISRHSTGMQTFIVSCSGADEPGILTAVSRKLTDNDCEFVDVNVHVRPKESGTEFILVCEVDAPAHLTLSGIKRLTGELSKQLGLDFLIVPAGLDDLDELIEVGGI